LAVLIFALLFPAEERIKCDSGRMVFAVNGVIEYLK